MNERAGAAEISRSPKPTVEIDHRRRVIIV
jgi:hypothetical protein